MHVKKKKKEHNAVLSQPWNLSLWRLHSSLSYLTWIVLHVQHGKYILLNEKNALGLAVNGNQLH